MLILQFGNVLTLGSIQECITRKCVHRWKFTACWPAWCLQKYEPSHQILTAKGHQHMKSSKNTSKTSPNIVTMSSSLDMSYLWFHCLQSLKRWSATDRTSLRVVPGCPAHPQTLHPHHPLHKRWVTVFASKKMGKSMRFIHDGPILSSKHILGGNELMSLWHFNNLTNQNMKNNHSLRN